MTKTTLYNKLNRSEAEKLLLKEKFNRVVLSFYKYVIIKNPKKLRDDLFVNWTKLGVLGRTYLASEGINAQVSVPEQNVKAFRSKIDCYPVFYNVPFNFGLEKGASSFYKLTIKVKSQIVSDGLANSEYDFTKSGERLSAEKWNKKINEGAIVVDMRNHYESEIGHFEGALLPTSETFKQELPMVKSLLKGKEEKSILLYCTGGIRCEKASSYLINNGFKNVGQLQGGIISYVHQIKEKGLENKFKGKNFVFDDRIGEKVTDEIISNCHQCEKPCNNHTNCANLQCNLLFLQCEACKTKNLNCCSPSCINFLSRPKKEQKKLRINKKIFHNHKKVDLSLKFKS
mgnify:CR=1 FL=1